MLIVRAAFLAVLSLGLVGTSVLAQTSINPVLLDLLIKETKEGLPPLDNADILIEGSATARELRFESEPETSIKFWGTPHRNAGWVTKRRNLPKDVEPGVTYRDIGIGITIYSIFDNDAIVNDAVGNHSTSQPEVAPKASP